MDDRCLLCNSKLLTHSVRLNCIFCNNSAHIGCMNISRDEAKEMSDWICILCLQNTLPFIGIYEDSEYKTTIYENIYGNSLDYTKLNSLLFNPFEWNEIDTHIPMCDVDPDIQFFSESRFFNCQPCEYYTLKTLDKLYSDKSLKESTGVSMFLHNIRSLPRHFTELLVMLTDTGYKFDIIAITESWLSPINFDLYGMDGYHPPYQYYRDGKRGGGVMIYVKLSIAFRPRMDIKFKMESIESIFY